MAQHSSSTVLQERAGALGLQLVEVGVLQPRPQAPGQRVGPAARHAGVAGDGGQVRLDLRGAEADRAREVLVQHQELQDVPRLHLGGVDRR
jgi:hypothetical protein